MLTSHKNDTGAPALADRVADIPRVASQIEQCSQNLQPSGTNHGGGIIILGDGGTSSIRR